LLIAVTLLRSQKRFFFFNRKERRFFRKGRKAATESFADTVRTWLFVGIRQFTPCHVTGGKKIFAPTNNPLLHPVKDASLRSRDAERDVAKNLPSDASLRDAGKTKILPWLTTVLKRNSRKCQFINITLKPLISVFFIFFSVCIAQF
jgi:hypothetical protein